MMHKSASSGRMLTKVPSSMSNHYLISLVVGSTSRSWKSARTSDSRSVVALNVCPNLILLVFSLPAHGSGVGARMERLK